MLCNPLDSGLCCCWRCGSHWIVVWSVADCGKWGAEAHDEEVKACWVKGFRAALLCEDGDAAYGSSAGWNKSVVFKIARTSFEAEARHSSWSGDGRRFPSFVEGFVFCLLLVDFGPEAWWKYVGEGLEVFRRVVFWKDGRNCVAGGDFYSFVDSLVGHLKRLCGCPSARIRALCAGGWRSVSWFVLCWLLDLCMAWMWRRPLHFFRENFDAVFSLSRLYIADLYSFTKCDTLRGAQDQGSPEFWSFGLSVVSNR